MNTIDPAVFRKAAQIIRDSGHVKGAYVHKGAHCTLGAIIATVATEPAHVLDAADVAIIATIRTKSNPVLMDAADFLVTLIDDGEPCNCGQCHLSALQPNLHTVVKWNDKIERTEGDVIALLEQAADMALLDEEADIAVMELQVETVGAEL